MSEILQREFDCTSFGRAFLPIFFRATQLYIHIESCSNVGAKKVQRSVNRDIRMRTYVQRFRSLSENTILDTHRSTLPFYSYFLHSIHSSAFNRTDATKPTFTYSYLPNYIHTFVHAHPLLIFTYSYVPTYDMYCISTYVRGYVDTCVVYSHSF